MTDQKVTTPATPTELFDYIAAPAGMTVAAVIFIVATALLLRRAVLHYIAYRERNIHADLMVITAALVNVLLTLSARVCTPWPADSWFERPLADGTQTVSAWVYAVLTASLLALVFSAVIALAWGSAPMVVRAVGALLHRWAARSSGDQAEKLATLLDSAGPRHVS
ncbi:hypothetical protein PP352_21485 [Mycobacteroides abscessus]|nr:hypothetical protein [Mycobacteroides abscessus]